MSEESKVAEFQAVTYSSLTYDDAVQLLRITNSNALEAINKWFDIGEDGVRSLLRNSDAAWDNTAFGADRYGQRDDGSSIPTFNIEYAPGVDNYPHSGGPSGAPSRPPSRTSQRSGVSAHAGDAPLQSIENGQETGVTGSSQPYFGPARKEDYDNANWALVPATASTEFIPDALADSRTRMEHGPGFLKPIPNNDYLPALLTILHSIPLFRNTLLAPHAPMAADHEYWRGNDWWQGAADPPARTVDMFTGEEAANELDLIHETQRLMAFLDMSHRAYASIEALRNLDVWKESQTCPDDPVLKFLLDWSMAYTKFNPEIQWDGFLRSKFRTGDQTQDSFLLDAPVIEEPGLELSLYDVLDQALFGEENSTAHLMEISNVLILRLDAARPNATGLCCTVPDTLHVDRYLETNKAAVEAMFSEQKEVKTELKEIDSRIEKLKYHTPRKSAHTQPMETLMLLETSIKAFTLDESASKEDSDHVPILTQLRALHSNIERKLSALEEQKKKAQEALEEIRNRFRAPTASIDTMVNGAESPSEPQSKDSRVYSLWGVATSPGISYVLRPETRPDAPRGNQWWRIAYDYSSDPATIAYDAVTLDEVLEKARSDNHKALLVYTNDAATMVNPEPLSAALQKFVAQDDAVFENEKEQIRRGWEGHEASTGDHVIGDWMNDVPSNDSWPYPGAQDEGEQGGSGMSSTTLTPNTDLDDHGMPDMQEVNGGIEAWAGMASNASSDTVGVELMDTPGTQRSQGVVNYRDVEMSDVELDTVRDEPRVQHIEVVEEKMKEGG